MSSSAVFDTYARVPLAFDRGEGVWLFDAEGRRYLDFSSGIAVNSLGHAHPVLVKALTEQAGRLWHTSNVFRIPGQERLAQRYVEATFADKVFFTNSGAEALECAIKTARRYHYVNGHPERVKIVTFEGAFHGRTLATLAATNNPKYLEGFGPRVPGFVQLPVGDIDAVRAALGEDTAAILVEPIQGEGGVRLIAGQFLRDLRRLADETGTLLILDEVQSGVGRTGKLFAHEWAGITPDIMAIAKGMGGGFPVGACLATAEAAKGMTAGAHGSTFGGNPLAMAVGNAVLDVVLAPGFLDHIRRAGLLLKQGLAAIVDTYPTVFDQVRGEGLIAGLHCVVANTDALAAMREAGLIAVGAGENVVRLLPPLIISEAEIAEGLSRLDAAAANLSRRGNAKG